MFEAAIRIIEIGARDQTRLVSYLRKQGLCLNEESPQDAAKPTAAAKTRRRRRTNRRT